MKKKLVYQGNAENYQMMQFISAQCVYYGWEFHTEFRPEYDLGVNYLGEKLIKKEELVKAPWINFHPAPLPDFGGRNLAYNAIMNDAKEFGATIHYMDEGFDTGPIIEVDRFLIRPEYTAEKLCTIAYGMLEVLAYKYIPKFLRGETVFAYPNQGGHYYKLSKLDDEIRLSNNEKKRLRALYCPPHYPYIVMDGKKYFLKGELNEWFLEK